MRNVPFSDSRLAVCLVAVTLCLLRIYVHGVYPLSGANLPQTVGYGILMQSLSIFQKRVELETFTPWSLSKRFGGRLCNESRERTWTARQVFQVQENSPIDCLIDCPY